MERPLPPPRPHHTRRNGGPGTPTRGGAEARSPEGETHGGATPELKLELTVPPEVLRLLGWSQSPRTEFHVGETCKTGLIEEAKGPVEGPAEVHVTELTEGSTAELIEVLMAELAEGLTAELIKDQ